MTTKQLMKLLELPPVEFEAFCNKPANAKRLAELEKDVEAIAFAAVRLAAYIGERYGYGCGDRGHRDAVKASNRKVKAVRKVMGYHITRDLSY